MNNSKISYKSVVLHEDEQATKERHLKRLFELSSSHIGDIPQLDEPTYEQAQWVKRRMHGSARSWETCIEHKPWIFRWSYFILGDYQ